MKKCELLIPAGNMEALISAVDNGADAVYFAGKNFGARSFAENFTEEEIVEAIRYCHLFGVKAYIAVNTMIYESEINELMRYIEFLYVSGVDAVIMQDIGIITAVREKLPDLVIHASTQMHNINKEGIEYLKKIGIKRVVFARELTLKEINDIDVDIEKEAFIHGALCVSYSGNCLFSALVGGRSGNRGSCAGSCRLPYNLYENDDKIYLNDKYLLSMKELSNLDNLKDILDSNIDSLKIEGRMKSSTYVAFITRLYRVLIDKYYKGESIKVSDEDKLNLATIFNREFTKGYINGENNTDIVNGKSPNHVGVYIGKVLDIKDKIKIKLEEDLSQEDGIRIGNKDGMIVNFLYDKDKKLTNFVKKGDICYLDNKINVNIDDKVYKTISSKLVSEIKNYEKRKIPVTLQVKAKYNELLIVGYDNIKLKGNIVQPSITRPTTKDEIIKSLSKLGNTKFYVADIVTDIDDDIFVSVSELNDLRRRCIDLLEDYKTNTGSKNNIQNIKKDELKVEITNDISVLVRNEEQLKHLLTKKVNKIYTTDYSLYKKYKMDERVTYRVSRASHLLDDYKGERLLISDLGSLYKYSKDNYCISDAYMNIANSFALHELHKRGVKKVTLSYELDEENLRRMLKDYEGKYKNKANVEVVVYGKPELMIMKYSILDKYIKNINSGSNYYLEDRIGEKYKIINENDLTYIMHYKNINLINDIDYLKSMGVSNIRIDLLDEDKELIDELLDKLGI